MTSPRHESSSSWWMDMFVIALVLGLFFFMILGKRPLFIPDEGRYAEIAREMSISHNYITPYLNGIIYLEKPILFYWLLSLVIKLSGLSVWGLRSVNASLALFGCLLTYYTTRKLHDRQTGIFAALILGTSPLYFFMGQMINMDLTVTFFLMLCLYSFLLGTEESSNFKRRIYIWVAGSSAALAVLTKGLIGIVLPLLIIINWLCFTKQWRLIKKLYLPSTVVIFLLITVPWHVMVGWQNPGFSYFYFIQQHFLRYTQDHIGHYQPIWFFVPVLLLGFFPWIVFLPNAVLHFINSKLAKRELFFGLWIACIFIFFTISHSKLIPYILPIFPPLAIMLARFGLTPNMLTYKLANVSAILLATAIMAASIWYMHMIAPQQNTIATLYIDIGATLLVIGTVIAWFYSGHILKMFTIITITSITFLLFSLAAIPGIDNGNIYSLAKKLTPILRPQDDVIAYNQYYQDLPFYLQRTILILNWHNELTFGMEQQKNSTQLINDATFWQRWHSKQRVFVVLGLNEYLIMLKKHPQEDFFLLGTTVNNALICNSSLKNSLRISQYTQN